MANESTISGVAFGKERTARQMRDRAQWERDQAAKIRAAKRPVGWEHLVEAHENVARAYEQQAGKREHAESGVQPKRAHATARNLSAVEEALGWAPEPEVVERAEAKYSDYSTNELRQEIRSLEDQFEMAGGRGVSLADRLDAARIALALRGSKPKRGHAKLQQQPFYGLRIVASERAGYTPGKHVVQYKDGNGMWFDIGDPKSKAGAEAALKMEKHRVVGSKRSRAGGHSHALVKTDEGLVLQCDMSGSCKEPVTHIEDSGFVYCTKHGLQRRAAGQRCRKLTPAELKRLKRGETIARY